MKQRCFHCSAKGRCRIPSVDVDLCLGGVSAELGVLEKGGAHLRRRRSEEGGDVPILDSGSSCICRYIPSDCEAEAAVKPGPSEREETLRGEGAGAESGAIFDWNVLHDLGKEVEKEHGRISTQMSSCEGVDGFRGEAACGEGELVGKRDLVEHHADDLDGDWRASHDGRRGGARRGARERGRCGERASSSGRCERESGGVSSARSSLIFLSPPAQPQLT